MKKYRLICFCFLLLFIISILNLQTNQISAAPLLSKTYHNLASGPLLQDWSDPDLIVANDDWSKVPSIEGFSGVFLTNNDETDPQTILAPDTTGKLNVFPNQHSPNTFQNGGVAEFDYFNYESIALSGSGTANAPYIKFYLNSSTCSDIRVKYNVKDLDGSDDNVQQQVALHYRNNESVNFTNIPEAYIADATEGPNESGKSTAVDVTLPSDANNQTMLEIRIMTANALGEDEWVGIDDIDISATCLDPYVAPIIPNCPAEITTYEGQPTNTTFSASDQDGTVSQVILLSDPIQGIQLDSILPAQNNGGALTGQLMIGDDTPKGEYEVQLQFSNNDPIPQTATCTIPINVNSQTCFQSDTHQIGEIQGAGTSSPIDASSIVTTSGVVTATFFEGGINGFYLQDPSGDGDISTSDGLFVSHLSDTIEVGQPLKVTGSVTEYYGRTQLVDLTRLEVCGIPSSVAPVTLFLPNPSQIYFEQYENMLVTFSQSLFINGHHNFDNYGELILSSQRHLNPTSLVLPGSVDYERLKNANQLDQIILDDGKKTYRPNPMVHPNGNMILLDNLFRGGDTLKNITGILDYSYGSFRIHPTQPAQYTNANPRSSLTEEVGGTITVASFNVMNYFTTLGSRGAADETELLRQREKLFATITRLNADIIGLVEIENNDNSVHDFVSGINAAIGAETYSFIDTGIIGVDEIKVALIYKPASVSPAGDFTILDANIDARFNDDKNRPSLAQTFHDNANNKNFTVAVNHFKSKGSSCEDIGDPDLKDGAGNCNLTRLGAAQALVDWLATDPTQSNSHDYLIIGDLNAYRQEQPIQAILAGPDDENSSLDDYTDLIHQFIGENAYTYLYDGQLGYLDHALANPFLTQRVTGASIWHINADEPNFLDYHLTAQNLFLFSPDVFRSSDHDPILIGLDFSTDIPPIAYPQVIETGVEDQPLPIKLVAIDEYNRPITFQITTPPSNGTLQKSGNQVTYTPFDDYVGTDLFTFIANNGIQNSNQATISLTIQPVNYPPIAKSDAYEIQQNQTLQVPSPGVLANDSDPENEHLTAVLHTIPTRGNLTFNTDGSFSYKPEDDFTGEVNFTYKAFDGKEYSAETIVTIKINPKTSSSENKTYLPLIVNNQ